MAKERIIRISGAGQTVVESLKTPEVRAAIESCVSAKNSAKTPATDGREAGRALSQIIRHVFSKNVKASLGKRDLKAVKAMIRQSFGDDDGKTIGEYVSKVNRVLADHSQRDSIRRDWAETMIVESDDLYPLSAMYADVTFNLRDKLDGVVNKALDLGISHSEIHSALAELAKMTGKVDRSGASNATEKAA